MRNKRCHSRILEVQIVDVYQRHLTQDLRPPHDAPRSSHISGRVHTEIPAQVVSRQQMHTLSNHCSTRPRARSDIQLYGARPKKYVCKRSEVGGIGDVVVGLGTHVSLHYYTGREGNWYMKSKLVHRKASYAVTSFGRRRLAEVKDHGKKGVCCGLWFRSLLGFLLGFLVDVVAFVGFFS